MGNIDIKVPVIVRKIKVNKVSEYQIRPLFFEYPVVCDRRYERAEERFKNDLKLGFKEFKLTRETLPSYLWYKYNPSVHYKVIHCKFDIGKQYVRGNFAYAYFSEGNHDFLFFPRLNNYMSMLSEEEKDDIEATARGIIHKKLKQFKKYASDSSLDTDSYESSENEFLSTITCNIGIKSEGFNFGRNSMQDLFASMRQATDFQGATELHKVGHELNAKFPASLQSAWYREDLVSRLEMAIFSTENTPFVLVGREGVGKKSILHEALYRYIEKQGGDSNTEHHQKIWYIDPTRVASGMSIVGQWQKRLEAILEFVMTRRKDIDATFLELDKILIDNVVAVFRVGQTSQNDMNMSKLLKPYLEKRQLPLIVLATPEEWKIVQEKDRRFADLFRVIRVEEPSLPNAVKMVLQTRKLLELEHEVQITIHGIEQLFTIHRNYYKHQALPGGVMKLLKQMAVKYRYRKITAGIVRQEFEDYSQLSQEIMDGEIPFYKEEIKDRLVTRLVGQEKAVGALADAIHMIKAGLTDPSKPKASFLFIGPTGVGKTQAVKVLAQTILNSEAQLMRFDMNEYIDATAPARLIGDIYNPEGILTGKVRYNPFGVVLLDEIEKAHPKIHDLLLQVLDDGRLTDSLGRTVDFTNTIIIMTSNVGANQVSSRVGFGHNTTSEVDAIYRKAVENRFRPEFVNRIDKIVVFNPLQPKHILGIARLQINELLKRDGFVRRTTILNITEDALAWVSDRGFNEQMGGRALKRQIEEDLTALSAQQLLEAGANTSIILDIKLEHHQLIPSITPLEFVEPLEGTWFPSLPEEKKGGRFYHSLYRIIEQLEQDIQALETGSEDEDLIVIGEAQTDEDVDWQYYDFKNRLLEIKEQVNETRMGFRSKYFKGGPASPLRLKGGGLGSFIPRNEKNANRGYILQLKDKLFKQEALTELNEYYRLTSEQFDSMNTEFIDNFMDVAYIALQTQGYLNGENDTITLKYTSCIEGKGKEEIDYLMGIHANFLDQMNIHLEYNRKVKTIAATAYALKEMLRGEQGIHLFYRTYETPLPIRVDLITESEQEETTLQVVRVYDLKGTLSDLRSDFSNVVQISPDEFKLLLYAGWKEEFRLEV